MYTINKLLLLLLHDFDRVSDYHDNGSTPLQGQQDKQPEAGNGAENAIEHDAVDILREYPPWSTETYDLCDSDETIYDRNRKRYKVILMKLFMIEIEKRYKVNYLKTHLLKLKTIGPI